MVHNPDIDPDSHPNGSTLVVVGRELSVEISAEELADFMNADSAMGYVPEIGETNYEAGASVDLNPADRPSLFASITDEAIF